MPIRRTLAVGALSAIALAGFAGAPANAGTTDVAVDATSCAQVSDAVATAKSKFLDAQRAYNARKDAVTAEQAKADRAAARQARTDAKAARKSAREGLKGHARAEHAHGAKAARASAKGTHGKSADAAHGKTAKGTHSKSAAAKAHLLALKEAANTAKADWQEAKAAWNEVKDACAAAETDAEQPADTTGPGDTTTEPTEPTEPTVPNEPAEPAVA